MIRLMTPRRWAGAALLGGIVLLMLLVGAPHTSAATSAKVAMPIAYGSLMSSQPLTTPPPMSPTPLPGPIQVTTGPDTDYQPSYVWLGGSSYLLAFERFTNTTGDIYITTSSDGGLSWAAPSAVISTTAYERGPALVQLHSGTFVMTYLRGDSASGPYHIYRATSPDGLSWTVQGPVQLGWASGDINPQMEVEPDGSLVMAYQLLSGGAYIAHSTDGGVTWDQSQTVVQAGARLPRVTRASGGNYFYTYQAGSGNNLDIYVKQSPDRVNWSAAVRLTFSNNSHDSYPLVVGSNLVVFYITSLSGNPYDIYYRVGDLALDFAPEHQVTNDSSMDVEPHPVYVSGFPQGVRLAWGHSTNNDLDYDILFNPYVPIDYSGVPTMTPTFTPAPPTSTPTMMPPTSTPTLTATPGAATNTPLATDTPIVSETATPAASETATPSPTPTLCPNIFVDIDGNVFYHAIVVLHCFNNIFAGVDSTHYGPAGTATRAQFAKVVVLGFGVPAYTPAVPDFTDVPSNYFAYAFIEAGYHAGILSGYDAASCGAAGAAFPCYLSNRPITRGQLTKLVVGAAGYAVYTPTTPTFADVPASNIFYVSIETAHHKGIVNGYADNTFRPNNSIRRDEMAGIMYQAIITWR